MIRKYLERNSNIIFKCDTIDGRRITRIVVKEDYWVNNISFIEFILLSLFDFFSGKYGYRTTISCK